MLDWLQKLESLEMIQALQESSWLYPSLEVFHILSFGVLLGSATLWDLRLFGFFKKISLMDFKQMALPIARMAFGSAAAAGVLLFLSNPVETVQNQAFQIKLVLLFLAVTNTVVFHVRFKHEPMQNLNGQPKAQAKIHAALSIFLWASVVTAGRWIAYV